MISPRVACCVLNYMGTDSAIRAVQALQGLDYDNFEIVLIENGSTNGEYEIFQKQLKGVTILRHQVNQGFAGGMNLGLKWFLEGDFDFVWLTTKDLTVEPDCLKHLVETWYQLETPGFLGSLTDLNNTDEIYFMQAQIDASGRSRHKGEHTLISEWEELSGKSYGSTDYVNGSCVFTSRNVIENVGLIPEDYFLYFEDTEWGLRAKRLGLKNYVSYKSRTHHHRELASSGFSRTAEYYCRRNTYLFKKRNGFEKPWTKMSLLIRNFRHWLKAKWKKQDREAEVLLHVCRDLISEKSGLGPYR